MKYKHHEIEIDPANPFANCKLDRKLYADILTNIVSHADDGFTMGLYGKWGSGKTTFVKMWNQQLKNLRYITIYLNAWEEDYVNDPFIPIFNAFMQILPKGNLKGEIKKEYEVLYNKLKDIHQWGKLAYGVGTGLLANKIGDKTVDAIKDFLGSEVPNSSQKLSEMKSYMQELKSFRTSLGNLVGNQFQKKPLIIIVDELDRCKPDYAILYLERIKHFFDIDNVVFVLALDKDQLRASVRGYYGSDTINADEYLRRFIDVEYYLPEPDFRKYCVYLYDYYNFDVLFGVTAKRNNISLSEATSIGINMRDLIIEIAKYDNLSLRQLEKLFAQMYLATSIYPINHTSHIVGILVYIKMFHESVYAKLHSSTSSASEIINCLCKIFALELQSDENNLRHLLTYIIGEITYLYNNSKRREFRDPLVGQDSSQSTQLLVHDLMNNIDKFELTKVFVNLQRDYGWGEKSLDDFFPMIDMTANTFKFD